MSLLRGNQRATTNLSSDSTAEEVMLWLAHFPGKAKVSASVTQGNLPWESGTTTLQVNWDAQKVSDDLDQSWTNLDRAESIVTRIDILKKIQKCIKDVFAHRELDGGPRAAMTHDLYLRAQTEIDSLEEELTQLI
mgnify:FL=1